MFTTGIGFSRFTIQSAENIGSTYKTITINKTYVPSTQTNYVLKLDASILGSDFFTKLSVGGSPRFTMSDGVTQLAHEKVYLSTGSSKGYYNVLIPTVNDTSAGSSTSIRVYYENSLSDLNVNAPHGRNAVWINNYRCMQHLHTTPNLTQVNSTGNASYDMTGLGNLLSTDVVTACYGGGNAHLYDATGQGIKASFCDITSFPFSIGALFKTPTSGSDVGGHICGISDSTSAGSAYGLYKWAPIKSPVLFGHNGSQVGQTGVATSSTDVNSTNWFYAVAVYTSATSRSIFCNTNYDTVTSNYPFSGNHSSTFISYADFSTDQVFSNSGDLAVQDFFVMNSAMSQSTFITTYNNYTNASFFTVT